MGIIIIFSFIFHVFCVMYAKAEGVIERTDPNILEDAKLDTFSLIKKYGYRCEIHRVYTEDNYILEMHRVPHDKADKSEGNRPVVFLQHGLLSSSAEWVLMTPGKGLGKGLFRSERYPLLLAVEKSEWVCVNFSVHTKADIAIERGNEYSLAYLLADAGYDVWMGNARGNTYSRNHASLKPSSSSFWQFSWHEIGYYDLPAMIDYVIEETGVQKIQYIGFSQGTTAFWVMMSTRPEYNDKVSAMQALAPIAFISNIKSPLIRAVAPFTNSLERVLKILGTNEILPNGMINELAGQKLCTEEAFTQVLCTNLLFLICGFNDEQLNKSMLPVVLGHTPAGASSRQIIHFGQLYKSDKFQHFDNGWLSNIRRYGSFKPPEYTLSNIQTPIFLHYSDNDWLSTPDDVHKLSKEIKSVVGKFRVPMAEFNHLDFVFAINATELIYNRVLNIMEYFR